MGGECARALQGSARRPMFRNPPRRTRGQGAQAVPLHEKQWLRMLVMCARAHARCTCLILLIAPPAPRPAYAERGIGSAETWHYARKLQRKGHSALPAVRRGAAPSAHVERVEVVLHLDAGASASNVSAGPTPPAAPFFPAEPRHSRRVAVRSTARGHGLCVLHLELFGRGGP